MSLAPQDFWQDIYPAGTFASPPADGFAELYPAALPDGRQIALPLRVLPSGDGAVASLIANQASFAVEDALVEVMAGLARPFAPEVIVGVPTLGLPLANGVARRLGHERMVALGTSRKFWYVEELSEPISSITSPNQAKRIFLDPRLLPLLEGRRVVVVDDVVSSGASITAVLRLLERIGTLPAAAIFAMAQGDAWKKAIAGADRKDRVPILAATTSPVFRKDANGRWRPHP